MGTTSHEFVGGWRSGKLLLHFFLPAKFLIFFIGSVDECHFSDEAPGIVLRSNSIMMKITTFLLLTSFLFLSAELLGENGQSTFKSKCAACHSVGKGKLVGPDLKNVHTRYENSWLRNWIRSSQSLVKAGDAAAVKLFEENNKVPMPDNEISDAEMDALLAYIKETGEKPVTSNPIVAVNEKSPTPVIDPFPFFEGLTVFYAAFVLLLFVIVLKYVIFKLADDIS